MNDGIDEGIFWLIWVPAGLALAAMWLILLSPLLVPYLAVRWIAGRQRADRLAYGSPWPCWWSPSVPIKCSYGSSIHGHSTLVEVLWATRDPQGPSAYHQKGPTGPVHRLRRPDRQAAGPAWAAPRNGTGGYLPVWQCITDLAFEPLASMGEMEALDLHAGIERIVQRAEKADRQIIAWSNHELDVVRAYCPDLVERFESRYVNARTFAEYWRNKCHDPGKPKSATLASYLRLIGYAVPESRTGTCRRDHPPGSQVLGKGRGLTASRRPASSLGRSTRTQPPRLHRHAQGLPDRRGGDRRPLTGSDAGSGSYCRCRFT